MSLLHDLLRPTADATQISAKLKDVNMGLDTPRPDGRLLHLQRMDGVMTMNSLMSCQCQGLQGECPHVQCPDPHHQQDQAPHRVKPKVRFTLFT